jgi:hypothetical protein
MNRNHGATPNMVDIERRTQAVSVAMVIVLVVLLVQFWLLTAAIDHFLARRAGMALPTFLASVACFLVNLRLLRYVVEIDDANKE